MKLAEVAQSIKENTLSKDQLEDYHSQLCAFRAELRQEYATLKKEKALFMLDRQDSVASRKIQWEASSRGQRQIEIEGYIGSTGDLISSVKTRMFNIY